MNQMQQQTMPKDSCVLTSSLVPQDIWVRREIPMVACMTMLIIMQKIHSCELCYAWKRQMGPTHLRLAENEAHQAY
jgi:hypothetical protein